MAAAMEARAAEMDAGCGVNLAVNMLRPIPVQPVRIRVAEVRTGGRVTVLSADLEVEGKLSARAHATFVRPVEGLAVPEPQPEPREPSGEPYQLDWYGGEPWFWDTIEVLRDGPVRMWVRHVIPTVVPMGALAMATSLADSASGLSRPDEPSARVVAGFPNADITIHLARPPRDEWLALESRSHWYGNGIGFVDTALFDRHGPIGRCAQSLVILPPD